MLSRKNTRLVNLEGLSSLRRCAGIAPAKSLIALCLGAVLCTALIVYLTREEPADRPQAQSPPSERLDATPEIESETQIARSNSEPRPEPTPADVNEQIDHFKQLKRQIANELYEKFPQQGEALILMGNVARDLGDTSEAVHYWNKALQAGLQRPDLHEGIAMIAMEKGQYDDAVNNWRKSLELNPNATGLRTSIAQALMRLGKLDEALTEVNRQIEKYPTSRTAIFLAGQVFLQKKQYEKAREKYLAVLELDPNHTNANYGLLTVSARLKEKDKVAQYRKKFNELKARDTKKLIDDNKIADDLTNARKSFATTAFGAAQLSERLGLTEHATKLLDQATEASRNQPDILIEIAQWHYSRARPQISLEIHEQIAQNFPQNGFNYFQLGMIYAQSRRFDDARKALKTSIKYSPDTPDALRELARLSLHMRKDIALAKTHAEKAVALAPTAENYLILGQACDVNGDRKAALEAMQKAITLDPTNKRYKMIYDHLSKQEP